MAVQKGTAMENINKIAKRLRKELGKEVKIEAVISSLTKRGFTLLYTDTDEGIEQLEYYNLTEYAKNKKCFTYISSVKLIFVDGTLNKNDIIKLLIHELAHIDLRHIGYADHHICDEVSAEIEADAVVYNVLCNNSKKYSQAISIVISVLLITALGVTFLKQEQHATPISTAPSKIVEEAQEYPAYDIADVYDIADTVYVTRTGKRFHRGSCRYVKSDGATPLSRDEATKSYTPCKVCKP